MLETLKERLKELAALPINNFADRVRDRSGEKEDFPEITKELRAFIMVMPDMIAQLRAWMDEPKTPASLKELHGYMMTYLYHPVDFLPEEEDGLFGYLDDAYLVGSVYSRIYGGMNHVTRRHLPHMDGVSKQLPYWLSRTESLLPAETRKITSMLDELSEGNPISFNRMMEHQETQRP